MGVVSTAPWFYDNLADADTLNEISLRLRGSQDGSRARAGAGDSTETGTSPRDAIVVRTETFEFSLHLDQVSFPSVHPCAGTIAGDGSVYVVIPFGAKSVTSGEGGFYKLPDIEAVVDGDPQSHTYTPNPHCEERRGSLRSEGGLTGQFVLDGPVHGERLSITVLHSSLQNPILRTLDIG